MKYLILLCATLISVSIFAQNGYEVTFDERDYSPIVDGDTLISNRWDDPELTIDVPVDVYLFNTTQPNTFITDIGLILQNDAEDTLSAIIPFGADLVSSELDTTSSPIISDLEGSDGDRILTFEWRNAHFYYLEGFFDFVNFQFKYYEATRVIEMSYGPSETDLAVIAYQEEGEVFGGPVGIGLGDSDDLIIGVFLEGQASNPSVSTDELQEVVGFPNENALFRFAPIQVSTDDKSYDANCFNFLHYTQLARVDILGQHNDIFLFDMNGRMLKQLNENAHSLDLHGLPSGVYFLQDPSCGTGVKISHQQ